MNDTRKQHRNWKRAMLIVLLVSSTILLTACGDADWSLFWDLGLDWATDQGIVNNDNADFTKIGEKVASDTLDQMLGSPEQSALDAWEVVNEITADDMIAQDGAASGDPDRIEIAMKHRPKDWTYTELYGATLLAEGDIDASKQAFENSESLAVDAIHSGADCQRTYRNLFEHRLAALQQQQSLYPDNRDISAEITHTQTLLTQGIPQFCG